MIESEKIVSEVMTTENNVTLTVMDSSNHASNEQFFFLYGHFSKC